MPLSHHFINVLKPFAKKRHQLTLKFALFFASLFPFPRRFRRSLAIPNDRAAIGQRLQLFALKHRRPVRPLRLWHVVEVCKEFDCSAASIQCVEHPIRSMLASTLHRGLHMKMCVGHRRQPGSRVLAGQPHLWARFGQHFGALQFGLDRMSLDFQSTGQPWSIAVKKDAFTIRWEGVGEGERSLGKLPRSHICITQPNHTQAHTHITQRGYKFWFSIGCRWPHRPCKKANKKFIFNLKHTHTQTTT